MSHTKSLVFACLAFSALPFVSGCGSGGGDGASALAASPPPADSLITTLQGLTQNWDKNLPSSSRYTVLAAFNNEAVRDNNTGLVWEQAPDAVQRTWRSAKDYCLQKTVGGTAGWRLPSVVELMSVRDPSLPIPFVPGSVFTGLGAASVFWSDTIVAAAETPFVIVYDVFFNTATSPLGSTPTTSTLLAWCARGPMQESAY